MSIEAQAPPEAVASPPRPMPHKGSTRLPAATHLWVVGGYAVLTLMLTFPVVLRLFSEIPGGGDAWHNIWNLWWVKDALVDRHINPYHTDMLYYPDGVNLYLHTLTLSAGLMSIPLQQLGLNLLACYNLVMLASFVLGGYGAFLLCHYLTGNRWASFVGGAAFAFAPYHFAHLYGHMNLATLQWIPFCVLLLIRAADEAGGRGSGVAGQRLRTGETNGTDPAVGRGHFSRSGLLWACGAGALLAVNAYTDLMYAAFLVMFTLLFVAWRLLLPSERASFQDRGVGWSEGALRVAAGLAVFLLLTAPLIMPSLAEAQKGYAQQTENETMIYSSDVMLAFTPSELHPIWGRIVTHRVSALGTYLAQKGPSERVIFLGYTVMLLAGIAAWRLRRNRRVLFWAVCALAFWILTLGPMLQVFGRTRVPLLGVSIPMPYALLERLPVLNIMRTPSRLTVLVVLAMSVLAAYGLVALMERTHAREPGPACRRWPGWRRAAIAWGLPLLLLFEFLAIPFPTAPPAWNVPIYAQMAREPDNYAVLELPLRPLGDYMAFQTIHHKPIIGGFLARQAPYPLVEQTPTLQYLLDSAEASGSLRDAVGNGKGLATLQQLKVKYVIIHWWLLTPDQKNQMEAKLNALFGRPADLVYPPDQAAAWQLFP